MVCVVLQHSAEAFAAVKFCIWWQPFQMTAFDGSHFKDPGWRVDSPDLGGPSRFLWILGTQTPHSKYRPKWTSPSKVKISRFFTSWGWHIWVLNNITQIGVLSACCTVIEMLKDGALIRELTFCDFVTVRNKEVRWHFKTEVVCTQDWKMTN